MNKYVKSFDTLRFIAVLLVIIYHQSGLSTGFYLLDIGRVGVQLFFTLSGFLITSILLSQRKHDTPRATLKSFFVKRSLRIFPLYYFVLFVFYKYSGIVNYPVSTLLYGVNLDYFLNLPAPLPPIHFWSLCIEEQYYLFWPFAVLFFSLKNLKRFIIGSIIFAFVFRAATDSLPHNTYFLMLSHLDSLGIGALISYALNVEKRKLDFVSGKLILGVLAVYISGSLLLTNVVALHNIHITLTAIVAGLIVIYLLKTPKSHAVSKVLEFPVFVYLGKISYGLYIYHPFLKIIIAKANLFAVNHQLFIPMTRMYLFPSFENAVFFNIYYSALLVLICTASWYLLEKPIKELSSYFLDERKTAEIVR